MSLSGNTHRLGQFRRSSKHYIPLTPLPARDQFRQNIIRLIQTTMTEAETDQATVSLPGLKKIPPYWYPYTTMAKMRWLGRELLEVVSTEFRDRSIEYYRYALESGVTTVNGKIAKADTILKDGDRIENVVHRHEPPVSSRPVKILHHDVEREFVVVDKPGSIPVHASGRYYKNTLIEILVNEFGFARVYPANRLDRLTSGLMIIPLSADRARELTTEFVAGTVQKEYVARCKGRFPDKVVCEEPLLTVDRQMGLNIVHPEGKPAKTIFFLIRYDMNTDSSLVRCRPLTGRSHQIRVHLQFLGHPIANDPVYSEKRIWGESVGRGGIDITPSEERSAPAPPEHLQSQVEGKGNPESLSKDSADANIPTRVSTVSKLLPRETGQDIGMGSPVPLSREAVEVITRLRNMKDEDEDWSRWRDVIFRAKGALSPRNLVIKPAPPQNRRKRGGKGEFTTGANSVVPSETGSSPTPSGVARRLSDEAAPAPGSTLDSSPAPLSTTTTPTISEQLPQLTTEEALEKISQMEPHPDPNTVVKSENLYCPECYLPLHPDPEPEKLYIFLHALKYTTSLGAYETEMPEWAGEGYEWDQT